MKPQTPQAIQSCHDLLAWVIPLLDQFPRNRRFTLGERIESGLLTVLEKLTDAAYRKDKTQSLNEAIRKLAIVRHLWRLSMELKVISKKRYHHGTELLVDLGRQLGGWSKAAHSF